MGWTVQTDAASEPLTKTEVRYQLKNEGITADDDLLDIYIKAARQMVERKTNTALLSQTIDENFDSFPAATDKNPFGALELSVSPAASVTILSYKDADGDTQTIDSTNYDVDTTTKPARVAPVPDYSWPASYSGVNAVTVRYVAGYTNTTILPFPLKQAMFLAIAHWYRIREDSPRKLPSQSEWILKDYRVTKF